MVIVIVFFFWEFDDYGLWVLILVYGFGFLEVGTRP